MASVKASMKANTYNLRIYLTREFSIERAECEYTRGLEICHHIGAAMFASRYDTSRTDIPCTWVHQHLNMTMLEHAEIFSM